MSSVAREGVPKKVTSTLKCDGRKEPDVQHREPGEKKRSKCQGLPGKLPLTALHSTSILSYSNHFFLSFGDRVI